MAGLYGSISDPLLGIGPTPDYSPDYVSAGSDSFPVIHDAPPEFYDDPLNLPPDHSESEEIPEPQQSTREEQIAATRAHILQRDRYKPKTGLEDYLPDQTLSPLDKLLLGVGRGLESGYSGLMGAGEAVSRGLAWGGQTPVSRYFQGEGDLARKQAASFENPEKQTDIAGWIGEQIGGFVPLALDSLAGGLPGFVISGATQAAGSSFKRAQEAFSANGDSNTKAALKALPVGIISGGINALITKYFSPDGTAGQALAKGLDQVGLTGIVKAAAEAAGLGSGWGSSEALSQDLFEKLTDNPDKPIGEIATNVLSSAVAGGGLGLGMAGFHTAGQKLFQRFATQITQSPGYARESQPLVPDTMGPRDLRSFEQVLPSNEMSDESVRYAETPKTKAEDFVNPTTYTREEQRLSSRFEPGDVQISQAGDAFLKMPSGKNGVNILNRMGLITDDEMFDMGDPAARLKIFWNVADRLEADGLSGLVDEKGRTVSTKVLRGQLDQAEAQPNTGASEEFQRAQAEQSVPVREPEMPAPTPPNVQRAGLRRGLQISDQSIQQPQEEVSSAITPRNEQESFQQQRQIGDGQVQGNGPDRNQPTAEQAGSAAPVTGDSVQPTAAQQIDTLYHGTNRLFDQFRSGVPMRARAGTANRFYFTSNPDVAAEVSEAGGFQQVSIERVMSKDMMDETEAVDYLKEELKKALDAGLKIAFMQDDGSYVWASSVNDLNSYEKLDSTRVYNLTKKRPRVIEAKVVGRTIDLRNPRNIPPDLVVIMKNEGYYDPTSPQYNDYGHERSSVLLDWMRENGYTKARLRDSHESGGESWLALPEAIKETREIPSRYFPVEQTSQPATAQQIKQAEAQVDQNPSEAQKEAGNYQKGHVTIHGLDMTIENPVGSTRSGVDKGGKSWSVTMPATYGYVKGTEGKDGDHVDIYLGPQPDLQNVYVVDQQNAETKKFDEHKVMIGFPDQQSAVATYDRAFSDNKGPQRRASVTETTIDQFKNWLAKGDQTKPFAQSSFAKGGEFNAKEEGRQEGLLNQTVPGAAITPAPAQGPSDPRERINWLMDESKRLAKTDREAGWNMIVEAGDLRAKVIDDEIAKVPENATSVKLETPLRHGRQNFILITKSAQPGYAGKWQATRMDERGPSGHSVHDTLRAALKYELDHYDYRVVDIRTPTQRGPAAPTTKSASNGSSLANAQPSIIDYIRDNIGLIKGKGSAKPGSEGYYGKNYTAVIQKHSAVRKLFTNKGRGVSPDEVVHDLRAAGYLNQNASWDDVIDLLDKAGLQLKGQAGAEQSFNREVEEKAKQREDFEKVLQPRLRPTTAIHTANLLVGDEFKLFGEKVTVKNLLFDPETDHLAYVELENGRRFGTQLVGAEHVLHVDHDSYKANPEATEFLPKSDRDKSADEIRAIDEQINELRAKEKLTTEDHRRLELLEQQRGQKMIEFTEPQAVADEAAREAARQAKLAQMPRGNLELSGETIQPEQGEIRFDLPPKGSQFRQAVVRFVDETPFNTFDGFRSKVAQSSLPFGVKRSMLALMDTPGLRDLNWGGFFFGLGRGLPEGTGGFSFKNLIGIDSANATVTTLAHELFHPLYNGLPDAEKAAVEASRIAEIRRQYGSGAPAKLLAGTMISDEFESSGLPESDYPLINPNEYNTTLAGNKFAEAFFKKEYPAIGMWERLMDWLKSMWQAVKKFLGPKDRRIVDDIINRQFAGEFQPKAESGSVEPRASFLQSAEGARNAEKLTEGTAYQKTEAAHALAQGVDFVRILDGKGAAHASPLAQSLLRYGDYAQYKRSGTNLNGGTIQDFRALIARTDLSDYEKKWMARIAARQAATFHQTLEEAQRIGTESDRQMRSPGFLKQLAREAVLHSQLNQAEAINRASDLILNSAYEQAWKALREEQHNDLEVAQLEAQLREIDEARKSSSAMVQLLKDMVSVLSSSAKGQQLLMDPNVRRSDLAEAYRDLKKTTGQPIQAESLVNWGSFVLARASDLRNDLTAAYYQQANPYVQHGLSHYEKMLFDDLKKDPSGTIYREVRLAKKRQSNEDKLRFTWWQLNRDVMAKLAKLTGEVEAGLIAHSTMADQNYRDTTNLMKKEGGWIGQGKVIQPYVDTTLMTPGGRAVDISTSSMRGSGVRDKLWKEWEDARKEFTDHINNNVDDADNPLYQRQLNALEEYYHDETIRNPHDRDLIWAGAADAVQEAAFRAGGSTAASLARAIQKWTMVKDRGAAQVQYDGPKFFLARDRTLISHGLKTDMTGGKEPIEVVSRRFYGDHLNEVMYSLNRQAGPLKVGYETRNGYKVTPEDLDEAALQSDIYERAWKVVKDAFGGEDFHVTITDPRTGLTMTMTPVKGTRHFVARRFEPNQKPFADAFVRSLGAEDEARKVVNGLDPKVTAAQKADATRRIATEQQKQIELLEAPGTWDRHLYGFVKDRNPDFAHVTPFDGPGKAFELAAPLATRSQLKTFEQFIDFLVAHSAVPKAEARAIVLAEWKRLIGGVGKDEESPLVVDPKSAVKKNSFTKGRMEAHAPFTFYRYGLMDGSDLSLLLSYVHSRALERVENGLVAVQKDLEERISELRNKADLSSRNKVISARETEVRSGKNFDSYEDLNKRKGVVDRVLRYLADPDPEDKGDITWRRITGGATVAIVQNSMTTLQNMIGSWMFLGRLSVRLNSKPIFDYPMAFWYTFTQIPFAAYHVGRAGTRAAIHGVAGLGRAVKEAQSAHNKGRRIRAFASVPLENVIFELGEKMFKAYAPDLVKQGINPIQNKQDDLRARMLLGWARGGRIGSEELTGGKRVRHSILGAIEVPMSITGTILPTIGDLSQNKASMAMLANNPIGFRKSTQRALNKIFKAGLRTFNWDDLKDQVNTLSHKELGYFTKQGMEEASVWMRESGLSLQTEAMKYLKALHDGVLKPEFLSGDSFTMFIDHQIAALNKATAANKAITLESPKPIVRLTRPLLGWTIRTWNLMQRLFSGASHDERRWIWWALGTTLGVLPFLLGEIGAGMVSDDLARLMSKYWYGKESNKKMPWEYDTTQQRVLALGKNAAYNVPFLGLVMNTMLGDVPTRASATPSFVLLEKFKDLTGYVGGVAQTGNPAFGLGKVATSLVPESRVIFNRIPSEVGRIQSQDASALIRRYAPTDLVKPLQPASVAGVLTELSPYGNMLENQALMGDDEAFRHVYSKAVETAKKLGLAKPEERVRQSFLARNPIDRVFKIKPTQRQLNDLMAGMSADEQAKVGQVMSNFRHAAGLVGAEVEFTEEPSVPAIRTGGGGLRNNIGQLPAFNRRGR